MAMRGSTVRGTPVHHIDANAGQGQAAGKPGGMVGTVHQQFDSDRRGYQEHPDGGTPYHSDNGNPPGAKRTVGDHPTHGVVLSEGGLDMNDKNQSIGRGVVLDDGSHDYAEGYETDARTPTMDSPVPADAPIFDTRTIPVEDRAHLGSGLEHLAEPRHNNDLRKLDGVMSRGMVGTTGRDRPVNEVLEEDTQTPGNESEPRAPGARIIHGKD